MPLQGFIFHLLFYLFTFSTRKSAVAQWKRAGLITLMSPDRNRAALFFFVFLHSSRNQHVDFIFHEIIFTTIYDGTLFDCSPTPSLLTFRHCKHQSRELLTTSSTRRTSKSRVSQDQTLISPSFQSLRLGYSSWYSWSAEVLHWNFSDCSALTSKSYKIDKIDNFRTLRQDR